MEIRNSEGGQLRGPAGNGEDQIRSFDDGSGGHTRRERERRRRKEEIIAAASRLFAQHGIEKTTMKQIADETDVSVGKLYTYFKGKEEVIHELLEHAIMELDRKGDDAGRIADAPLEQLRRRLRAAVEHFKEHIDFLMIYHNENPMSCEGMIREAITRTTENAAKLLAQAIDNGDIPPEDPYALAAVFVGAAHELLDMFAEQGNKEAFDMIPDIIDRIVLKPLEMKQETDAGMEGR